jgi:hypothetical protein
MTYRELTMMDVKELLRRWAARHSNRKIARVTGTDRGTASRYIAMAEALGLSRDPPSPVQRARTFSICDARHDLLSYVAEPQRLPDKEACFWSSSLRLPLHS